MQTNRGTMKLNFVILSSFVQHSGNSIHPQTYLYISKLAQIKPTKLVHPIRTSIFF